MRDLIINADDFGMSAEVNEGVKRAVELGVLNNVSLMVNLPNFAEAVGFLREHPEVSVGLHFNITEGKSVLPPNEVSSLLREDDSFYHWTSLIPRLIFRDSRTLEIIKELWAQYQKLKETGLEITHVDSHHHMHLYPPVFKALTQLADKEAIKSLRCHHFNLWDLTAGIGKPPTFKQLVINLGLWVNNRLYNHKHLGEVDRIYDLNWDENMTEEELIQILDHLPEGVTELICHLGILSTTGNRKFLEPRLRKLEILSKPRVRDRILNNGIHLVQRNGRKSESLIKLNLGAESVPVVVPTHSNGNSGRIDQENG